MGQRSDPNGLRLGINRGWDSVWYAKKGYRDLVQEDLKIRAFFKKALASAGVSKVVIARPQKKKPHVTVYVARPGLVIGKKGVGIDALMAQLKDAVGVECFFNIVELRKPALYAQVVAEEIAQQLQRRASYKRVMRKAIQDADKVGAQGIRIDCSGRMGGAEIARSVRDSRGRLPAQTLRADIDYGFCTAYTRSGTCGVKVWIYRGDILDKADSLVERRLGELSVNRLR